MTDIYYHLSHFVFVGYTVTSVVSARSGQLYVAGAPRFNHTGKVIIFTLKNTGELTILHSLKGQQVMKLKICIQTLASLLCVYSSPVYCIEYLLYKQQWSIGHCVFNLVFFPGFHLRWCDCLDCKFIPHSPCASHHSPKACKYIFTNKTQS